MARPFEYKPEYVEQVREWLKQGYCKTEISYLLDVNTKTFDRWVQNFPELREVIEEDKCFAEGWWLMEGKANLANGKYNTRMYELQMMNRFGWKKNAESKNESTYHLNDISQKAKENVETY